MAFIVETGSGVPGANAYITTTYFSAYHTERGNEFNTINAVLLGTSDWREAIIEATDYIDRNNADRFIGVKEFLFTGAKAQGVLSVADVPAASDTVEVGEIEYTFVATLADYAINEVLIGATAADCADNLIAAISAGTDDAGTLFSAAQKANRSTTAALETGSTTTIIFTAIQTGTAGNDTPFDISSPGADLVQLTTEFVFGQDAGEQDRQFPRAGAYAGGQRVTGVPLVLRQATAEYALRALSATLFRDPTVDDTGRSVVFKDESIGPIQDVTRYEEGSGVAQLIKPYPAADALLESLLKAPGGAYR